MNNRLNTIFWTGVIAPFLTIIVIISFSPSVTAVENGEKHSQEITLNICKKKGSQNGRLESLEIPEFLSSTSNKLTFRVTPYTPSCKSKIELSLRSSTNPGLINFLPNGYFRNDTEYFHPSEYCIKSSNKGLKISLCQLQCSSKRACSQKCCPLGQILVDRVGCVDETLLSAGVDSHLNSFNNFPKLNIKYLQRIPHYERTNDKEEMTAESLTLIPFHYTTTTSKVIKSNCKPLNVTPEYVNDGDKHRELFKVTLSGNLVVKHQANDSWHTIFPGYYCLNDVQDRGTLIYMCPHGAMPIEGEINRTRSLIIGIVLILSSIFLLLTFIVYAFILKQRNVHAWTTMSLTATMFFTYTFLAISHFIIAHEYRTEDGEPTGRCVAIGILAHYFFLSMFFWLTAVCFDLWWTFRAITPKNKNATGWSRFLAHAAFGWGVPLIIIIVSVSLNFFYSCTISDDSSYCVLLPKYGVESCYLKRESLGAYLYYPAAALLTLNWIFFLLTFYKLHEYKKSTKVAMQNTQAKRRLLVLCLKLFFVMGISWLLEIISWLYSDGADTEWYWYIPDIFNIFQSVAIFLIFTCKKETLDALKAMMPEKKSTNYRVVPTKSSSTIKDSQPDTNIRLASLTKADGQDSYTETTISTTNDFVS